jgi:hypothetical protein
MTRTRTITPIALAVALAAAGCSSTSPTPTAVAHTASPVAVKTSPKAAASPSPAPSCTLPDNRDLIERDDDPGASILAEEIGEVDLENCTPTLDEFQQTAGHGAGECTTIAWASDNPGYDVNAVPAPPLKDVIESAGPGC